MGSPTTIPQIDGKDFDTPETDAEELDTAKIMSMLDAKNSPLLQALNSDSDAITACLSRSSRTTTIPQDFIAKALIMGSGLGLASKREGRKEGRTRKQRKERTA